ncbi:MAG: hypothetical protein HZB85_04520 [Deltaproteobacteria bacterium]|nr:hypothetical protein [Deltaproteobacteria bacterium]
MLRDGAAGAPSDVSSRGFIADAEAFAAKHRTRSIFKALKFYTRCNDYEFDFLIRKIYASSIESSQYVHESALKTLFGVLLLPFHLIATKRLLWKARALTMYNVDTPDEAYFRTRYADIYSALKGTKRVTPRYSGGICGHDTTEPASVSISPRALLLFLVCPLVAIPLYFFCLASGLNIMRSYRNALGLYATYDGYFRRYPCERFITYAEDTNHPSRYIAFRQNGGRSLIAVQNGERGAHPSWSFGMVDVYFVFGAYYTGLLKEAGYHAGSVFPVGSLSLNMHYARLNAALRRIEYDIVYIDNGTLVPPDYGGLAPDVARSEELALAHLGRFKAAHPGLRVAYQLRPYGGNAAHRAGALAALRRCFTGEIDILENTGGGESYDNIRAARLVINFQSTMGFEAFMLGTKALFVNYSGHANETLCDDPRFQLDGSDKSYKAFEAKVEELLGLELAGPPEVALRRHAAFDGRVQERIAAAINGIG